MLIISFIEYFFVKNKVNNYIEAKTIGIFTAILSITSFFYIYTGITGRSTAVINILIFIISIILGECVAYKIIIKENDSSKITKILSIVILIILTFYFIIFTYITPKINYFKDPVTGGYGKNI